MGVSVALVELAARMLREHADADLPELCCVAVRDYGTEIEMQLGARAGDRLLGMARWAHALGVDVVVTPGSSSYKVTVTKDVLAADRGEPSRVEVWTYLDLPEAMRLVSLLGIELNGDVKPLHVSPSRLLQLLGAVPTDGAEVA